MQGISAVVGLVCFQSLRVFEKICKRCAVMTTSYSLQVCLDVSLYTEDVKVHLVVRGVVEGKNESWSVYNMVT